MPEPKTDQMSRRAFLKIAGGGIAATFLRPDNKFSPSSEVRLEPFGVGSVVKVSFMKEGKEQFIKLSSYDGKTTLEIPYPNEQKYPSSVEVAQGQKPEEAIRAALDQNTYVWFNRFNNSPNPNQGIIQDADVSELFGSEPDRPVKEFVVMGSDRSVAYGLSGNLMLIEVPRKEDFNTLLSNPMLWAEIDKYTFFQTQGREVGQLTFTDAGESQSNNGMLYIEGEGGNFQRTYLKQHISNPALGLPQQVNILGQVGRLSNRG